MEIMMQKGYTNTGIQEILNALQVPKGSFYHYFDSKENYALEIIRHFDLSYAANLMRILRNPDVSALERLRSYCETAKASLESQGCRKGCLIGNLSQEMADQSEVLRCELASVMRKWRDMFAACIQEGQASGEIKSHFSPDEMAELFLSAWNGAVLRAKTVKNTEPIDTFIKLFFEDLLKA